jgi:hypothetical protein
MKTYKAEDLFSDIQDDPDNVLLTFPPEVIADTGWQPGDTLNIEIINGCMHITKVDDGGAE